MEYFEKSASYCRTIFLIDFIRFYIVRWQILCYTKTQTMECGRKIANESQILLCEFKLPDVDSTVFE